MDSTYVIAEIGVNHNGSIELAKQLIDVAAKAGVDAVKFQTFRATDLVTASAEKAEYQKSAVGGGSQYEMLAALELDVRAHETLSRYAREHALDFLSTPFDVKSLEFLVNEMRIPKIKISSGDITNAPLLLAAARCQLPIILSTGMSTLGEVEDALAVIAYGLTTNRDSIKPSRQPFRAAFASSAGQNALRKYVTLLHCTTEYPTPVEDVNLSAMSTMSAAFGVGVGYSDHTEGIAVPVAAVAMGAMIIEKHFTLDRSLPGPDHRASLEPKELEEMVRAIRAVEKAVGRREKYPTSSEQRTSRVSRRSIVAAKPIELGEVFSESNLALKRPAGGLSPMEYWDILGKKAPKAFAIDEQVHL